MPVSMLVKGTAFALIVAMLNSRSPANAQEVETIDLPADPPARRTVALETVWRIGADDEDILLGLVTSGVLDDEGNVLLVDRQLRHVLVISPDGDVIATLGREGDGPGEMRRPQSVFVAENRVGLVQDFPGRVVFLDRDGLPAGGFEIGGDAVEGGAFAIQELKYSGGTLVVQMSRSSNDFDSERSMTRASLSVMNLEGLVSTELASHQVNRGMRQVVIDEAASWAEFDSWALSPKGVVATVAERDAWVLNVRNLAGDLLQVLRRPYQTCRRTKEEKEEAIQRIHLSAVVVGASFETRPLDRDQAILDLQYTADGRLFVTSCRNAPGRLEPGVAGRFDVISPEGEFLEELTVTYSDYVAGQDLLVFLDGACFLILKNYEDTERAIYAAFMPAEEQADLGDAKPFEVVFVRIPR